MRFYLNAPSSTHLICLLFSLDTFQPFLFLQYKSSIVDTYETFNRAVDSFFSGLEESRISSKTFTQEKAAFKKLTNIRKDHDKRIGELERTQVSLYCLHP